MRRLKLLSHLELDDSLVSMGFNNANHKFENDMWRTRVKHPRKEATYNHLNQNVDTFTNTMRRRLQEQQQQQPQGSNLEAEPPENAPSSQDTFDSVPITRGSGSFPAIPNSKSPLSPPSLPNTDASQDDGGDEEPAKGPIQHNHISWDWICFLMALLSAVLCAFILVIMFLCRRRAGRTIAPWKTGISGQLQKAFVTGVPKLNRLELETACEEYSNIIDTYDGGIIYKGILSSGVEISVVSTTATSRKEWSRTAEKAYRKKVRSFYKDMEHLDWPSRVRVIMGVAYCLTYMHHDTNPPVSHSCLSSRSILLSDDYAAKVAEVPFLSQAAMKAKLSCEDDSEHSELPAMIDPETNVYSFGLIILEVITGKLPYSEREGSIEKWAAEYLSDKSKYTQMVDPSLKSKFKTKDFEVLCEVAQECIKPDPRQRPTMKDIIPRLREVITITCAQAVPRLSPLWWAELELLEDS
ncbi:Protein MALE DISCOVERER 1 [Linum perenne]